MQDENLSRRPNDLRARSGRAVNPAGGLAVLASLVFSACGAAPPAKGDEVPQLTKACASGAAAACMELVRDHPEMSADALAQVHELACGAGVEELCVKAVRVAAGKDPARAEALLRQLVCRGGASSCDGGLGRRLLHQSHDIFVDEHARRPLYERGLALLEAACAAGSSDACDLAAAEHEQGPEAWRDEGRRLAFLKARCDAADRPRCLDLAYALAEKEPARSAEAFSTGCGEDPECLDKAANALEEHDLSRSRAFRRSACLQGRRESCERWGYSLKKRDPAERVEIEATFRARCGDSVPCLENAVLLFVEANDPERAAVFLDLACQKGDERSCASLPFMLVELPAPKSARGVELLLQRCDQKADARACDHLSGLHEWGRLVPESAAKAKQYAKRGCELGDAQACSHHRQLTAPAGPARSILSLPGDIVRTLLSPLGR